VSSTSSRRSRHAATGAAALLLAACASLPPDRPPALPAGTPAVELTATPFFPQTAWQCGPAALATVLGAAGVAASPDDLAGQVYIPARRGSLQVELVAAARRAGQVPWLLEGNLAAVSGELTAGHPVLVLQDVGRFGIRRWHYAVVIGTDPAQDALLLRSGRERQLRMPAHRFAASWQPGGNWALVVLPPGSLPATADRDGAIATLTDAEGLLPAPALAATWQAAAARWPADPALAFGAANAARAAGDLAAAEAGYRAMLARDPADVLALNNLADLLLDAGCTAEARALADRATAAASARDAPESWRAAVADTAARAAACAVPAGDR
jgi:tetratricopeptide (TPR) repeat protein